MEWIAARVQLIEIPPGDRSKLLKLLPDAHALIVRTYTIVDDALLDYAPDLRVIARAGVGLDNIDLDACRNRKIQVVHTPSANTDAVVEYVISMILHALRPIAVSNNPMSDSDWHALREASITPRTCVGARLGIIGFGKIGSCLARAALALGMEVVYHDIRDITESDRQGCTPLTLTEMARSCDVISVHVDGRVSNRHLISNEFFDQLKPDSIFINTSRGFVIDETAAAEFARANIVSTLILDVHGSEPIAADSPVNDISNVIRTPHIAAGTRSAKDQMSWVVRDVIRVLEGQEPEFPAKDTNR